MKRSFFQLPKNLPTDARNAFLFVSTLGLAHIAAVPYYLYLVSNNAASQFYTLAITSAVLGLLLGVGAFLSWQGKHIQGMILALGSMAVVYPLFSGIVSGLGLVLGPTLMLIGTLSAIQVFARKTGQVMAGVAIVSGLATLAIDIFGSSTRPALPSLVIPLLAFFAIGILILFGLREINKIRTSVSYKLIFIVVIVLLITAAFQIVFSNWTTQKNLQDEARDVMFSYNTTYQTRIQTESLAAEALAISVANRVDVQDAYLRGDRERLYNLLQPMFEQWKDRQVVHLYIENPDGTVFLRVHDPKKFGDDITYRGTAKTALEQKRVTSGVEIGPNRLGVRSVAPIYSSDGEFIGLAEVGMDFDEQFVSDLKRNTGADYTMWVLRDAAAIPNLKPVEGAPDAPIDEVFHYASTTSEERLVEPEVYRSVLDTGTPAFQVASTGAGPSIIYITPLLGYQGKVIGLMQISESYNKHIEAQKAALMTALGVTAGLTILGLFLIALFSARFVVEPLNKLSEFAIRQMSGETSLRVSVNTGDEFQQLGQTFNLLADTVAQERTTLEERVVERTRNLELAAEVGRTVSQVRSLDVLLTDAAELIRTQFDLYYVQVYLVNSSQTYLNLQAGTGHVGKELLARNHRLAFNSASINGRAAVERKSAVITDTTTSATFKPNPLLPDTRSEMAVPLLIGDRVVGVLDMQSQTAGSLNQDVLPAFEALAGQLAIAIQNASFLAETQQAQAEVEAQAQRLTRSNWASYLDAIHMPEETGYVFEQDKVIPLAGEVEVKENALVKPITVTGEALGNLVIESEGQLPIARVDELLDAVARQVSQQIENLRLLDSAERYRLEAEEASRRITREGWKSYASKTDEGLNYVYDLKQVRSHKGDDQQAEMEGYRLPLKVHDQTIGKLVVQGLDAADSEAVELANAVAERLGAHIESLRQYDQAQSALIQSEKLFEASSSLTRATGLQELVAATITTLGISEVNRALLVTFDYDAKGELSHLDVIANWWNGTGHEVTPLGTRYPREVIRVMPMFISQTPVFFDDTLTDERVDATTLDLVKRLNLRAVAVLPLHVGSYQMGALILEAEEPHHFTQEETRLFSALAPQVATVVENRRQFEQAQKQAERESRLNVISQKIQSATTVEAVLQIAARELGHTLGAPLTIAQLGLKENSNGN